MNKLLNNALELLQVDRLGLDHIDHKLLRGMIEKFRGGPVGLETIAATIGEESHTIEDVYEPYLLQIGFLQRTPRGRIVTELAYQHLGLEVHDILTGMAKLLMIIGVIIFIIGFSCNLFQLESFQVILSLKREVLPFIFLLVTSIVLSIILSLIFYFIGKFR